MYGNPQKYENSNIYEDDNDGYEEYGLEAGLDERIQLQLAKEQQFIDDLEDDAAERLIVTRHFMVDGKSILFSAV